MCPEQKPLQKEGQEKVNLYKTQHTQLWHSFKGVNFVICVGQTGDNISKAWEFNDKLRGAGRKNPSRLFEVNHA